MHFTQLVYLTEIVKHGSISAAAKSLFISQSALSQSIVSLENEFGATLIKRSRYGVKPTYFGKQVCDDSESLIRQFNSAVERWTSARDESSKISGRVHVICTPGSNDYLSGVVLDELHTTFPNIILVLQQTAEMRTGFKPFLDEKADIGLGSVVETDINDFKEQAEKAGFVFELLSKEQPLVLVGNKNRFAGKTELTREDLKQLDVVYYSDIPEPWYTSLFRSTACQLPNKESIVKFVAGSDAAAVFIPSSIRKEYNTKKRSLSLIPLAFSAPEAILPVCHYLIYRPVNKLSPAELRTLDVIRFHPYSSH